MKTFTYIASNNKSNFFFQNTFTYIASKIENNLNISYNSEDKNIIKENISIPLCIFSNGLSGLEAISKYLKEIKKLKYCEISKLLNRDDRTIWDAYSSVKKKSDDTFPDNIQNIQIPIDIFSDRSLSILESSTSYLKEELNLRYCQIASLLNKDPRTVWTAYNRAKKKRKNGKNS